VWKEFQRAVSVVSGCLKAQFHYCDSTDGFLHSVIVLCLTPGVCLCLQPLVAHLLFGAFASCCRYDMSGRLDCVRLTCVLLVRVLT
jgi:hypothetical protein